MLAAYAVCIDGPDAGKAVRLSRFDQDGYYTFTRGPLAEGRA